MASAGGTGVVASDPRPDPTGSGSPRLFFAIELPAALRARLRRIADELRRAVPGLRPVAPEHLHLTLAFLGAVDPAAAATAAARVRERVGSFAPFAFSLVGLGVFPGPGHARVLWCGVSDAGPLAALAGMVGEASRDVRPAEDHGFRAHVTIGRFRATPDRAVVAGLLAAHTGRDLGQVEARELTLQQSELGRGPLRHRVVARFALGAEQ